jgi:signal transduction histidine kinase/ActR/RegA family two-component response regulator
MAHLPTIPRDPLARLRLMSLWFAMFAIGVDVAATSVSHLASGPVRLIGVAAASILFAWVVRGYRRERFPEWTTPLEAVLLATITAAASLPIRAMGVFLAVVMLRALYVSRREFWLLPTSYGIARAIGIALTPAPAPYGALSLTVFFQFIGLLFISAILFVLMQALEAQARAETHLREAQKMHAVGQLAGGIAHDFNNLLTVIGGHVYLLERATPETPERTKHLEGITHTVERAGSLTRQLLAFGRRQVLHPTLVDLNAVVRSTARLLEPVVGERVRLEIDLDEELPAVRADVGQLEQVLLNIGLNARDAMPMGGTLRIATSSVGTNDQGEARVAFTDTGVGMDAETIAHVFEPFFTTKRGGRGTGLGLATAYGIIKQSGGDIEVTSAPGKGSTFTIALPTVEAPRAPARVDRMPTIPTGLKVKRALVVEDADGVRDFVRAALTSAGATVFVAGDGTEGLAVARAEGYAFDLVISDVVMPGLSGPQMVERLRDARPDLPVLFITGYADDALARDELKACRTALLEKPFTVGTLLEAAHAVVSDTRSPAGVATEVGRL